MQLRAIIFAGGIGSRLWPLSTPKQPKQFLKLFSGKSLFQLTILRNRFLGKPIILINKDHLFIAKKQLKEIETEAEIIVEPLRRNTAPSTILAANYAKAFDIRKIALIPCDHYIGNIGSYHEAIKLSDSVLQEHNIVTIGIQPTKFNPNYGYIEAFEKVDNILMVNKFKEKPTSSQKKNLLTIHIIIGTREYILSTLMLFCEKQVHYVQFLHIWLINHFKWLKLNKK